MTDQNTAIATRHETVGTIMLDSALFEQVQRAGKMLANSQLVPQHLRGQVADCSILLAMAIERGESPILLAQNVYFIKGTPGWKTQYLVARCNEARVFRSRIKWRTEGRGDSLRVTAYVTDHDGEVLEASVDMAMAKADGWTRNEKYRSMPEVMLRWRSAAMLIRFYAPEVMLGIQTVEEIETQPQRATVANVSPSSPPTGVQPRSSVVDVVAEVEAVTSQADEADATDEADAADLKARAQGIEAQLPPGSVAAIRQEHGIDPDVDITTWRGRARSAAAYLDDLSGELAAFREDEAAHSDNSNPMGF